ncbi:MAG TPA: hypothetical protein VIU46_05715 [Gallionellaceae bacterium]
MDTRLITLASIMVYTAMALGLAACGGGYGSGGMPVYSVGGTVTGLAGPGLVLRDNGTDNKAIGADGPFTFATPLAFGMTYNVTIASQPSSGPACAVTNGSGTVGYANVTNVSVHCP